RGFARVVNGQLDIGAFEVQQPVIASLSPPTAQEGGGSFPLTINGSNFEPGVTVDLGGTSLTPTSTGRTQLVVTVPSSVLSEEGSSSVTVVNPGSRSAAASFTVTDAPLTAGALTPPVATEGAPVTNALLFHFSDANPGGTASDFTAVISWGDGTTSPGTGVRSPERRVGGDGRAACAPWPTRGTARG